MAVDFDKLMSVFRKALEEHPPEEWDDFVQQAAGDDEELRRLSRLVPRFRAVLMSLIQLASGCSPLRPA